MGIYPIVNFNGLEKYVEKATANKSEENCIMLKRFAIEWDTDYCDDYPDPCGTMYVDAVDEDDALRKFWEHKPNLKAMPGRVFECGPDYE